METAGRSRAPSSFRCAEWIILSALAFCWIFFAWACGRLFALGDDANFLTEISQSYSYHVALSQYSYVWSPLYRLLGGDIALLRAAGALLLQVCAALFGWSLGGLLALPRRDRICLAGLAMVTAFWFYWLWNPTPNYNLLDLLGVLLFDAALFCSVRPGGTGRMLIEAALAGLALVLLLLAKPTSCLVAVLTGLGWLWAAAPQRPWLRLAATALSGALLLCLAALVMDGNLTAMLDRIAEGLAFLHARASNGQGYGLVSSVIGPLFPGRIWKVPPVVLLCAGIAAAVFFWLRRARAGASANAGAVSGVLLCVVLTAIIAVSRAMDAGKLTYFPLNHLWYLTPLFVLGTALLQGSRALLARPRQEVAALVVLLLTPFVFGVGTNSMIFRQMAGASVFWFCALAAIVQMLPRPQPAPLMRGVCLFGALSTIGLLAGVAYAPASLMAPLWAQTDSVVLGPEHKTLLMDPLSAASLHGLQVTADRAGLTPQTPIIDLGALGPGLVFALDGYAPVQPWLAYGKSTDAVFAEFALRREDPGLLRKAWIITTPQNREDTARDTLRSLGLNFPAGYEAVGSVQVEARGLAHTLWKPRLNP